MSDQELKFFQEIQELVSSLESMLHLSSAAHHHPTTTIPHKTTSESPDKYATTYSKKTIHFIANVIPRIISENGHSTFLFFPIHTAINAAAAAFAADHPLLGFTRLQLRHTFPIASPTPLGRTISGPINSIDTVNSPAPLPQFSSFASSPGPILNPPLQESSNRNSVQESSPIPNSAPVIHRTVSDLNPVSNLQVMATASMPPHPPLGKNVSGFPSCGKSPNTDIGLKRMKERLREMSQWWDQVVREGDEEDSESENYSRDNIPKVSVV